MNYFETIKAALDASFAGICDHLGLSREQACQTVKQHLATMSQEWFTGETPNIVYGDPLCRFAYLFCHVAANANLCEVAIRNSPDLCDFIDTTLGRTEELRICAFGGGPGTELLAISKFLLGRELPGHVEIQFTLLDRVPEWAETWNALEAQIKAELKENYGPQSKRPFSVSKTFVPFDMTKAHQYANLSKLLEHDLYVMNYVVSEVVGDHVKFQELINAASSAAPSGSKFLVVDRDQDSVIENTRNLLTTASLTVGNVRKSSTNMDSDERMSSLETYTSAIGRRPRLQWGSRTGRGAFFCRWDQTLMIISASYKTDIPTFYGEWFMNRLRSGYCKVVNAYNKRISRVPLDRDAVDAFVFWTKNIGPFYKHLAEIQSLGYPFVVQHTINNYPRALETSVVDSDRAVQHVRSISNEFGVSVCVWRYDTIVFSSLTPFDFHLKNFADLAARLSGCVDEAVISIAHVYRKTKRNLDSSAREFGFSWDDPDVETKRRLVSALAEIAECKKIRLTVCSQPELLSTGVGVARCVDADRICNVLGRDIKARLKGNRKECGCYHSIDIGEYDTCPHGCVYCYAVQNPELALDRYKRHDPASEFLFAPPLSVLGNDDNSKDEQLSLFPMID